MSSGTYSVDVLQTDGTPNAAYGLLLGAAREARTFTMLQISSDGFVWIGQCVQDCAEATTLIGEGWFESEAIHTGVGAMNNLRVRVDGVVMSFYINDTYIGEVESDEPISGDVGLAVETFGEGDVSVQFDNLRVTSP